MGKTAAKKQTKLAKPGIMLASKYAESLGFKCRPFRNKSTGVEDKSRMVVKTPGTSEDEKKALQSLIKATGLTVVRKRSDRIWTGHCHHYCSFKTKEFEKAKVKVYECPSCGEFRTDPTGSYCEHCGVIEKEDMREVERWTKKTQQPKAPPRPTERPVSSYDPDEDESDNENCNAYTEDKPDTSALEQRMASMEAKFDKLMAMLQKHK